ncbi:SapC family protein [Halomonas urumqiensis]|uniref:Multidrug transporter n=1 Tax=Halomonas urumqiensis TaxID=1684789 RepID=A0A2N7UCY3_9GAMM|nr:SapC family protein [Halomonas urumqiensis]PMR78277.1 multidrug transporter [Halomonas urumqiensis]PTB03424.1 multidrug transporter [Halomonas urumqiensis]
MQQLFYGNPVPLNSQRHRDLSLKTSKNFRFARHVNSCPVMAAEFSAVSAEYPIVFAGSDEAVLPAVVLGTRDGENLYVDNDGRWRGHYVPAFVRRYPFVFSSNPDGKTLVLNIDEEYEEFNRTGHGERLFDADGNQTQYLQTILRFLQEYQAQFQRTQAFCQQLLSLDLLQPMQAQFTLNSGEKRTLGGFRVVDREKLKALPSEELAGMCRRDELEVLYLHLASQRHFRGMLEHMSSPSESEGALAEPVTSAESEDMDGGETEAVDALGTGKDDSEKLASS